MRVQKVESMTDEELIKHLEKRHSAAYKLDIPGENRSVNYREMWNSFHNRIHELNNDFSHTHE